MDIIKRFERELSSGALIRPGERLYVACSGGPDSTALFHLLRLLPQKKWKLKLGLIHLNHGMRGKEALRDERFVKSLAREYGVSFRSSRVKALTHAKKMRLSPEEAARELRYEFFLKTCRESKVYKTALAHTLDDQAETVLMRLIQGTGSRGLLGIREIASAGKVKFIRPLLAFKKAEILAFLKDGDFHYQVDATNEENDFLRNRIRLKLLPFLTKEFNPRAVDALARLPVILKEEAEALEHFEREAVNRLVKGKGGRVKLKRDDFLSFPYAIQFRVLNHLLKRIDPRSGIDYDNWRLLRAGFSRTRYRHSLKKDIDIVLDRSSISIYKKGRSHKVN